MTFFQLVVCFFCPHPPFGHPLPKSGEGEIKEVLVGWAVRPNSSLSKNKQAGFAFDIENI